ncbi:TnsA-like heteromeric transposase endonuclease subunit [Agromyces italicus]|uniref:TnsA-like heteromeric transposase endonuclease subunit n=1 Tax=Agromyces italicus TaxID=279572 RepID=UPI0003B4A383|nr:TnsA-like heteromeric transposase endonuclease subunit [Agromyces italicus]
MSGRPATIQIRKSADHVESVPIADARLRLFESAVPWREFRWYKGQRHFSGSYWSATMDAPVGYESRLEYANLLLLDFDPRVRRLLSQPFLLEGDDRGTTRRHIPDFLIAHADDSVCVADVKPAEKLSLPKVRDSLGWSRRVIEAHGWEYRVLSEPDPTLFTNVQFLAGYRRAFQFVDTEVAAAIEALRTPQTFGEAAAFVQSIVGDHRRALALVLHLIWTRFLSTDLTLPLGRTSVLKPG